MTTTTKWMTRAGRPSLRLCLLLCLLLGTACDSEAKKGGAEGAASSSAEAKGDAAKEKAGSKTEGACAKYVAFLDKCLAQVPKEQKPALQETRDKYKQMLDDSKTAELKQMDQSCAMGLATTKKDALCKGVE